MRSLILAAFAAAVTTACARQLMVAGLVQPSTERLERARGFAWRHHAQGQLLIRSEAGSLAADQLPAIADTLSAAVEHVRSSLSLLPDSQPLHVFVVASMDRMDALLGHRVSGRAFPGTRVLALAVQGNWPATARHELTHVELRRAWGGDYEQWMSEGIATWVGNPFYGRNVHRLTRERLVATGRVLPLRRLAGEFGRHPDEVTYLQAASVAGFLHDRFGIAVLRAVWRDGLEALHRSTGLDASAFERAWLDAISQAP